MSWRAYQHEEHEEEEHHEDLILSNYLQKNAEMDGYELEFGRTFGFYQGELLVSFGSTISVNIERDSFGVLLVIMLKSRLEDFPF